MIHPYNNANASRWSHDEFRVRLDLPGHSQPFGYCDGTAEDEQELRSLTEMEGISELRIDKKVLKSGRQIWTVGEPPEPESDTW